MKNSAYWKIRFEQLEAASNKNAISTFNTIQEQYIAAEREIERQISTWYQRFAKNNQITMAEARKLLTSGELAEFKWNVQEYIKYGEQNALNPIWMKELENASARFHISRLEALKLETQQTIEKLFGGQLDEVDKLLKKTYLQNYYHTAYEIQKGWNIGWDIAAIDERTVEKLISKPWATDGKNFSDRIWSNKAALIDEVQKQLTRTIMLGKAPDDAIKAIAKKMKSSMGQAGRLVMTESAYFASQSQKDAFNALDVEKFEIVATLDSHTSEICRELDGHVEDMKNYEPGVTAPPFHPWCRTTTVPYFEDNYGERAARGADGKTYYVPSNMKYNDWKETFVDGGSKLGLKEVKENDIIDEPLFPKEIAGVKRGSPMTFDDANHGKPNPNFKQSHGYQINCQSCVVTYEARLRGYNVQTLPNTKGSMLDKLSRQTNMAWIDPATGKHPAYIFDEAANTVKKFYDFIEKTVEAQKRYTLQFSWKGRSRSGHIISMDRDEQGALRLYDPQTGQTYTGKQINAYLGRLKFTMSIGGVKVSTPPKILRIDDKQFNLDVVNYIMEGVK
ncbi:MAG TPA: minor capsid protein [Thermodesulfovibrio thiophilus]|nr:minor capsid protein [Thermodesulfovibrio thiophilus]